MGGFAAVSEYGVGKGKGGAIVHQAGVQADTPERRGPDFVGGVLAFRIREISPGALGKSLSVMLDGSLDDAVAGANVVQEEVAEGVECFITKGGRYGEVAAVNGSSGRGGGERCDVASDAANFVEHGLAMFSVGSLGECDVASGRFGGAYEAREVVDVSKPVGGGLIIGLLHGVAEVGDFVRLERISDAHLVEIGVSGEGEKAGMLILPAEAANAGRAGDFDDGNVEGLAADFAMVLLALILREIEEGLVGNSLDKSVAENIHRNAESPDILGVGHVLLDFGCGESTAGADGAVVNKRAAFNDLGTMIDGDFGELKPTLSIIVSDAQFGNLGGAAGGGILMALAAGLRVVKRAEALGDVQDRLKVVLIDRVGGGVDHTIALVVESGGGF